MNLEQVRQFALAVGTSVETVSGDWARVSCPLSFWTHDSGNDSNPSCAISYGDNIESAFNCYACEAGDLHKLITLLEGYGAKKPRFDLRQATTLWADEESGQATMVFMDDSDLANAHAQTIWPESFLEGFMQAWKVPMAMEYLNTRKVSQKVALALDIRWDLTRRTVCFPVRDWQGQLVGMRGRYIVPGDGPRYHDYGHRGQRNKLSWYGENLVDVDRPVVMVESVFDFTSVWRVYRNILAPLTVGMGPAKLRRVRNAFEIVTLFDNGKGGDKGRSKISEGLPESIITHLLPPAHADDPGDMTKKELRKVLKKHIVLDAH